MATIYVVTAGEYSGYHICGVYDDKEFAKRAEYVFKGHIEEWTVNEHADLIRSIRQNLFPLGDDVKFIPGHGPPSTFGRERQTNPFVADRLFG